MATENRSVLIVDDEPMIRDNLERLLKPIGYDTVVAASGDEALEIVATREFSIALLDIRMPGASGLEVLAHLHINHPDTAVIMVTAVADVTTAVDAMKAGAYDYIAKPFNIDDVVLRVQKALERRLLILQVKNHQKDIEEKLLERERELRNTTTTLVESLIRETTIAEGDSIGKAQANATPGAQAREFGLKVLRRLYGGDG